MLENSPENEINIKLNRAITEKTRPDTVSNQYNGPIFYNNLNSVLIRRSVVEGVYVVKMAKFRHEPSPQNR